MTQYEVAWRPYDRTPKGNVPKVMTFEAEDDLTALFIARYICYWNGDYSPEFDYQDAVNEDIEFFSTYGTPISLQGVVSYMNRTLDPSDSFIFYVKDLATGEYIYENDYSSGMWDKV